jgi:two-component system, cell cycle response regulator DivK
MSTRSDLTNVEESMANLSYGMDTPPTIMVVDDDDDIRLMIAQLLRSQGFSVIEAGSAAQAETRVLENPPHLILMDLRMPGTDGLSAIWNIRQQPEMATVPIIIVSAYDAFDLRAEATAAGCCGYLTKPVDPDQLKTMVGSVLESTY